MQSLDATVHSPLSLTGTQREPGGKTGAETARNGSSFLAIIEKMIAGTTEGRGGKTIPIPKTTERGAVGAHVVPGVEDAKEKPDVGKKLSFADSKTDAKALKARTLPEGGARKVGHDADALTAKDAASTQPEKKRGETAVVARLNRANARVPDESAAETVDPKALAKETERAKKGENPLDASQDAAVIVAAHTARAPKELASAETAIPKASAKDADSEILKTDAASSRKDRKPTIHVRDERTEQTQAAIDESPMTKTTKLVSDNQAAMTIGFRGVDSGKSAAGETRALSERKETDGQSFQSMLSQELKNNAADFVKTGQIILKNNNEGLIRLTLHPETLGNVKISLEVSGDRKITGKIVVSSREAYEAFNENLDGLSDAFVQGGFQSAGFDLSWSDSSGSGNGRGDADAQAAAKSPFYADSIPDVMLEAGTADTRRSGYGYAAQSAINVFA